MSHLTEGDGVYVRFLIEDTNTLKWYRGVVNGVSEDKDYHGPFYLCNIRYDDDGVVEERRLWLEDFGASQEGAWVKEQTPKQGLKPIFAWLGGKTKELSIIKKHMPKSYDIYVDPFVGGGALFFNVRPDFAVINDTNPDVMTMYSVIGNGRGKDLWHHIKNQKVPRCDEVRQAYYFIMERCNSFRGVYQPERCKKPVDETKLAKFEYICDDELHEALNNVVCTNIDFVDVMTRYNSPENFIFLDPPYHGCFNDYGGKSTFEDADFHRLLAAFKKSQAQCLLIVAATELTRRLFYKYIVDEYHVKYSVSNRVQKHLVIKNY